MLRTDLPSMPCKQWCSAMLVPVYFSVHDPCVLVELQFIFRSATFSANICVFFFVALPVFGMYCLTSSPSILHQISCTCYFPPHNVLFPYLIRHVSTSTFFQLLLCLKKDFWRCINNCCRHVRWGKKNSH